MSHRIVWGEFVEALESAKRFRGDIVLLIEPSTHITLHPECIIEFRDHKREVALLAPGGAVSFFFTERDVATITYNTRARAYELTLYHGDGKLWIPIDAAHGLKYSDSEE